MKKINVEITGVCPLLQNKFNVSQHGENSSKVKKKVYVPEEECLAASYKTEDGVFHPSEHILGALIKAGVQFKFEGKKTFKDLMKCAILVEPEMLPLLQKDSTQYMDWDEIDTRGVVIQRSRVVKWRPKYNEWKLCFKLTILQDDNISTAVLREILDYAGQYLGIGDYRPRFGRFQVTKWEEV